MNLSKILSKIRTRISQLHIFDLISLSVALIVIASLITFFNREKEFINISVKIAPDKSEWYSQESPKSGEYFHLFKPGIKKHNSVGNTVAEVTNMNFYNRSFKEDKESIYLDINIETVFNPKTHQFQYDGKPILIGAPIRLEMDNILVEGIVTDMDGVEDPRIDKEIIIVTRTNQFEGDISDSITNSIQIGDTIQDNYGNNLVEVIDKKTRPMSIVTYDIQGNPYLKQDPQRDDLILTLKVKVKEYQGLYWFEEKEKIFINNYIPLKFDKVKLISVITDFYELNQGETISN